MENILVNSLPEVLLYSLASAYNVVNMKFIDNIMQIKMENMMIIRDERILFTNMHISNNLSSFYVTLFNWDLLHDSNGGSTTLKGKYKILKKQIKALECPGTLLSYLIKIELKLKTFLNVAAEKRKQ